MPTIISPDSREVIGTSDDAPAIMRDCFPLEVFMKPRLLLATLMIGISFSVAISGCAGGGTMASNPTPTPVPTPSPTPVPATPLTVTSVSNASPVPLTALQIGTTGLDSSAAVLVQFANNAGFSVTEKPIRIISNGTIVASAPLFADPATGQIGPGAVSLTLVQGSRSSQQVPINIQDLPPVSTYGTSLGEITHAVLVLDAMLVGRRLSQFQAFQVLPGNTVDTTQAQATMKILLNATIQARSDVDRVSADNSVVISNGTLSDGSTLQFDKNSLDMMDRINAVFLTQTFATVLSSIPASPQTNAKPFTGRTRKRSRFLFQPAPAQPNVPPPSVPVAEATAVPQSAASVMQSVLKAIENADTLAAFEASALKLQNSQNWIDATEAIAGGISAITEQAKINNELLGAVATIVSDVHITAHVFADLAAYGTGLASGDQGILNAAIDDMNAIDTFDLYKTLFDLLTIPPRISEMGLVSVASTALNLIDLAREQLKATQDAHTTALSILNDFRTPFTANTHGIGIGEGLVVVSNPGGISAAQSGLDLCCFGAGSLGITGVADPNGNYDLFVPLQVPGTNYSSLTLQIVDPVSGTILGSTTVDLSGLNTSSIFLFPTATGTCLDNDAGSPDADDPDCD